MDMTEYSKVKDMTYLEYCDYLQDKYGLPPRPYCSENWSKYGKDISGTAYGLVIHHKMEDHAILLSSQPHMSKHPYEWQQRWNLVYCDFLEHLLLHILITENPAEDRVDSHVGGGGIGLIYEDILSFFVIGTNTSVDFISEGHLPVVRDKALLTLMPWQQTCFEAIKGDFDVWLALCERISSSHDKVLRETGFFGDVLRLAHSDEFMTTIANYTSMYLSRDALKAENASKYEKWKIKDETVNDYCQCSGNLGTKVGYEDEFGYWDVCCRCGRKLEDGHHYWDEPDLNN